MNAQLLGLFGGIGDAIGNAFSGIANWFSDRLGDWIYYIQGVVTKFIYEILKAFFLIIDFIQLIFKKISGLDTVYINNGSTTSEYNNDLVLMMLQSQQVIDVFISLLLVAVILLFVFTFIAIIRNQYNPEKSKGSNGPIISKALKALFTFIFVPVICYFGIYVSNGLLKTVDQATRANSATSISGEIFSASGNQANRVRTDSAFAELLQSDNGLNAGGLFSDRGSTVIGTTQTPADKIDRAFATKLKINAVNINAGYRDGQMRWMFNSANVGSIECFDYMNTELVYAYYDLTKFNWLIAFISCFFVGSALLVAALGVVQRLYELTILFAISPPFVALMPLDDGKAFGSWRKKFIESTLVMYGTVVSVNFFFIMCPILQNINLFGAADVATFGSDLVGLFNALAHVIFIICGALVIKDFSKLITGLVTGNDKADLMDRGGAMKGGIQNTVGSAYKGYSKAASTGNKMYKKWQGRGGGKDARHEKRLNKKEEKKYKSSLKKALREENEGKDGVGFFDKREQMREGMNLYRGVNNKELKQSLKNKVRGAFGKELEASRSENIQTANKASGKASDSLNKFRMRKQGFSTASNKKDERAKIKEAKKVALIKRKDAELEKANATARQGNGSSAERASARQQQSEIKERMGEQKAKEAVQAYRKGGSVNRNDKKREARKQHKENAGNASLEGSSAFASMFGDEKRTGAKKSLKAEQKKAQQNKNNK